CGESSGRARGDRLERPAVAQYRVLTFTSQREVVLLPFGRHCSAHEVMLHRGHPAIGDTLRVRGVVLVLDVELVIALSVEDGGTPIGVALHVEHRTLLLDDVPRELDGG